MARDLLNVKCNMEKTEKTKKEITKFESKVVAEVRDEKSLTLATEQIKTAKKLQELVKKEKDKFSQPAKQIIEAAKEKFDPLLALLKNIEGTLKGKCAAFMLHEQSKQDAIREKIQARVEKGTMKVETAIEKLESLPETLMSREGLRIQKRKDIEVPDVRELTDIEILTAAKSGYLAYDLVKMRKDLLSLSVMPKNMEFVKIVEKIVTQSV